MTTDELAALKALCAQPCTCMARSVGCGFCAAARTALPALIAEVERPEKWIADYRDCIDLSHQIADGICEYDGDDLPSQIEPFLQPLIGERDALRAEVERLTKPHADAAACAEAAFQDEQFRNAADGQDRVDCIARHIAPVFAERDALRQELSCVRSTSASIRQLSEQCATELRQHACITTAELHDFVCVTIEDVFAPVFTELAAARDESARLHEQLREGCTCGSGGHPRHCKRHPAAYKIHCDEIDRENAHEELIGLARAVADYDGEYDDIKFVMSVAALAAAVKEPGK